MSKEFKQKWKNSINEKEWKLRKLNRFLGIFFT